MPYAAGRTVHGADSHIMELPDFLTDFADPGVRDALPRISSGGGGRTLEGLEAAAARGGQRPEHVAERVALGADLSAGPKGYSRPSTSSASSSSPSNDALYLFSSDDPHFEGGRNPLGRFRRSLEGHAEQSQARFYSENFGRVGV